MLKRLLAITYNIENAKDKMLEAIQTSKEV